MCIQQIQNVKKIDIYYDIISYTSWNKRIETAANNIIYTDNKQGINTCIKLVFLVRMPSINLSIGYVI